MAPLWTKRTKRTFPFFRFVRFLLRRTWLRSCRHTCFVLLARFLLSWLVLKTNHHHPQSSNPILLLFFLHRPWCCTSVGTHYRRAPCLSLQWEKLAVLTVGKLTTNPTSLSSSCFSSKCSSLQLSVHWGKHGFAQFSAMGPFWKRRSDLVNEHTERHRKKDKDMGFVLFFNLLLESDKSHAMFMFSTLCALWEALICVVLTMVLSERENVILLLSKERERHGHCALLQLAVGER